MGIASTERNVMLIALGVILVSLGTACVGFGFLMLFEDDDALGILMIAVALGAMVVGFSFIFPKEDDKSGARKHAAYTKATKLCAPYAAHTAKVQDQNVLLVTCGNDTRQHQITWK